MSLGGGTPGSGMRSPYDGGRIGGRRDITPDQSLDIGNGSLFGWTPVEWTLEDKDTRKEKEVTTRRRRVKKRRLSPEY